MFGFSRALAIVGLMVLWRTGLVSFGHAFYFGLGAYAVAILDIQLGVTDVFLRLLAGALVAGLAGFLLGLYCEIIATFSLPCLTQRSRWFFSVLSLRLSR